MPKQSKPDDEKAGTMGQPNDASMKEPAEGSRENVNTGGSTPGTGSGGGITNRPLEQEQQEQRDLPPRGTSKDGSHA
jgi:hypothetical protein